MDENEETQGTTGVETPSTTITDPVILEIIAELGANYNASDESVLETIYENIVTIATTTSNTELTDSLIPYIKTATKSRVFSER